MGQRLCRTVSLKTPVEPFRQPAPEEDDGASVVTGKTDATPAGLGTLRGPSCVLEFSCDLSGSVDAGDRRDILAALEKAQRSPPKTRRRTISDIRRHMWSFATLSAVPEGRVEFAHAPLPGTVAEPTVLHESFSTAAQSRIRGPMYVYPPLFASRSSASM
jgi:hypothetical protein